ncbi:MULTISPECIES: HIT family protein [Ignavibacterium]|jgi:histidine triad (HIT) family protein|uniref:HIT family protein n=1 Tax=Ignavibacterium TaxID=795750 RepID=UPI0025C02782|nr:MULTISPECIES: HIT family protein [Ignavibacterium]MBI5663196.1 HIT family protein [Ignavibacterium album]
MDCIFCEIAQKKSPAEILFENEKFLAFLDINPINYGHTLVITKEHYDNFLTVPEKELSEITRLTQYLAGAVKRSLKADGFNIISNNGSSAGQTVYHFHYHIIPRFENDFMMKPRTKEYDDNEIKNFASQIKSFISKYEDLING